MNISTSYGDSIWPGISRTPFAIILVTDSIEFLINHPSPSPDFIDLGTDSILKTHVFYRKAVFNKQFLATFPAVNGLNTIVVGTPENTGLSTSEWIITLLHEHFHQYVDSSPGYYTEVENLNLSGGDKTGMWMLNYPFPYSDSSIAVQYEKYTGALANVIASIRSDSFDIFLKTYISERMKLQNLLKLSDYRYLSFQIWQEGIARYTEYKFLGMLENYEPATEVKRLPDFVSFKLFHRALYRNQTARITKWTLREHQRDCFYAIGLGEGLILDEIAPGWRDKYLTSRFYIERYSDKFDGIRLAK